MGEYGWEWGGVVVESAWDGAGGDLIREQRGFKVDRSTNEGGVDFISLPYGRSQISVSRARFLFEA